MVSCKTPELVDIVIRSFQKFVTDDFNLKFIIVENSNFNLTESIKEKFLNNVTVINNPINLILSYAHGSGLDISRHFISSNADYVFACHSDTCVTSNSFFEELKDCIQEKVYLAGVCEDACPDRIKALHCSGLLVKAEIFKSVSMMPILPQIDTADLLTVHCRDNKLKMKIFKNTYNDPMLVEICNSPFKELGKNCGIDRCLDRENNVMFIHQGRGTTKYVGDYYSPQKMTTADWLKFCSSFIQ
jgi:hypothetical protein